MKMLSRAFLLFMLAVGGFAQQAKAETIGAAFDKLNPFVTLLKDAVVESATARPDISVVVKDAGGSADKQMEQIKGLVADKVDAIILVPATPELIPQAAEIIAEAGIPYVFLNRLPPSDKLPGKFAIVASNEIVAGRLEMRMIASMLNGKGNLALLRGQDGEAAAVYRTAGTKEVLAKFPGIKLVKEATASWNRKKAEEIVSGWLNSGTKIDAVVANNDEMAIGAIRAFEKAGIPLSDVYIAGVDATPDALDEIEKGNLEVSIFQNARGQGATALDDAVKLARGKTAQLYDWVPFELVTQKVIANYKK